MPPRKYQNEANPKLEKRDAERMSRLAVRKLRKGIQQVESKEGGSKKRGRKGFEG